MKQIITRIKNGFVSSFCDTFRSITTHWRGFSILCLATIGGTACCIKAGLSTAWALTSASASLWALSA